MFVGAQIHTHMHMYVNGCMSESTLNSLLNIQKHHPHLMRKVLIKQPSDAWKDYAELKAK